MNEVYPDDPINYVRSSYGARVFAETPPASGKSRLSFIYDYDVSSYRPITDGTAAWFTQLNFRGPNAPGSLTGIQTGKLTASYLYDTVDNPLRTVRFIEMQLRVAFNGAHSTGKSTLLRKCKERFGDRLHPIENIARALIARGLPMGDRATLESLLEYVQAQLTAEQTAPQVDIVISDRTCIDSFAYARANADLRIPSALPEYAIKALGAIALRESDYYDLHVYFPIEFQAEYDPVRPGGGEVYRRAVDERIINFLNQNSIPYIPVSGDVSKRANTVFRELAINGVK